MFIKFITVMFILIILICVTVNDILWTVVIQPQVDIFMKFLLHSKYAQVVQLGQNIVDVQILLNSPRAFIHKPLKLLLLLPTAHVHQSRNVHVQH